MTQLCKTLWLIAVIATLLLLPSSGQAQTGSTVATTFVVDSGAGIGIGNAIAVDSKNVHLVYYSRGTATGVPPSVLYETFPLDLVALPVAQTVDTLTLNPSLIPPQAISLAIDSQGMPHIVYQDGQGGLKYAYIQNGIWTKEVIASSGAGTYNALALDKSDAPHVAFGGLTYATRATAPTGGIVWNTEIISSVKTLTGVSMVVDSQGQPRVAWAQHTPNDVVVYAARGTGLWTQEFVSSVDSDWVSLAIDATDTPSVSFWGWNGGAGALSGEVAYSTRMVSGTTAFWQTTLVDTINLPCCQPNPFNFNMTSLALSPTGDPRISYGSDAGVKFAKETTGTFSSQVVDAQAVDGFNFTSLAVDNTDAAHILFRSSSLNVCPTGANCLVYQKLVGPNTPLGSNVTVTPVDANTGTTPVTVTFAQVTQAGTTSVTSAGTFPSPPQGFLLGNPPVAYDVSTTAVYVPPVQVCIHYGNSFLNPANLELMHFENGAWVNRTTSNDLAQKMICASTNSLSPFGVFQQASLTATSISLTSSVNPSAAGQPVTFSAGLAGTTGIGQPAPTGSVTFLDGNTALGPAMALPTSGPAIFTTSALTPGVHTITAQYSGDSNYAGSTSSSLAQTVNLSTLQFNLTSSVNPSVAGQTVTFTSAIVGTNALPSGVPAPTGTVSFLDGSTSLGLPVLLSGSGSAALNVSTLSAGAHIVTAEYSGDSNFASSASNSVTQTVNKNSTATSLTPSSASVVVGQPITLSSTVSLAGTGSAPSGIPAPSGTVTFFDGTTALGAAVPLPTSGPATLIATTLAAGTHSLTAQYSGDAFYAAGTSTPIQVTVANVATTTALTSSSAASVYGQAVTFMAQVQSNTSGVPAGLVAFLDGTTALGSGTLDPTGLATFSTTSLGAGTHSITASYAANGNFPGSASVPIALVVGPASLTATANSFARLYGTNNPAFTGAIRGVMNSDPVTASFASATTPASPVGSYSIVPTAIGAPAVLANYSINLVNGTLTVAPETTSLSVSPVPSSIAVGQSSTVTVTLTAPDMVIPIDPSTLAPVTLTSAIASDVFSSNGTCTPVPSTSPGTASCTLTVTASVPNGRTLTASFAGSADFIASTGTAQLIVTEPVQGQQSCIQSDFRNVAVAGGNYIWFNSIFRIRDVPRQKVNVSFANSAVQFQYTDANGNLVSVSVPVPNANIVIDPSVSVASTSFDAVNNVWNTTLPWDLDDNAFLSGVPWLVPAGGIPADVEPVTWCGTFAVDVPDAHIGWRWAAAAYSTFSADNSVLGVKPMDSDDDNPATNHDHAGTPENYKQFVIAGARGKGARNFTGSYSRSNSIE